MNHTKQGQPSVIPTKLSDQQLSEEPKKHVRHNSAARITIAAVFFLLVLQIAAGLVLAAPIYSSRR